ncbi:hypothetical protein EDB81DRAFT_810166 [Dactylonectria macrodidyma]|uniref:F-box domain-containing protein n=1 Tax=Dactylonectria macrodidyma TaxID=307937 RepID=A0A9P9INW1_9HYPO|nr:hypothetical protein EDB81DRAFT_810166 [Dactylonectria macrodidyma]
MATRRSARLQNQELQADAVPEPAPVQAATSRKRKALVGKAKGPAPAKKRATEPEIVEEKQLPERQLPEKQLPFRTSPSAPNGLFSSLPIEILDLILSNIESPSAIGKLGRTCKAYHALIMPLLHKRVAVAASFHAHIPKLIRTLEPYLTINQKKQLKREGKYRGQQERYASNLDTKAKPACADYVRHMVVGASDPGKKHLYIVHRYIEEAFKNMGNLEIVETRVLTKSTAKSIASLKNLQALCLYATKFEPDDVKPLAKIKNLKHLEVEDYGLGGILGNKANVVGSMLLNSASTLRSLVIKSSSYSSNFLQDLEKKISEVDSPKGEKYSFTALTSLMLKGMWFDEEFINSLDKAIDFLSLKRLSFGHLGSGRSLVFQHLTNLVLSRDRTVSVGVRNFRLNMSQYGASATPQENQADMEHQCHFLSSFDTLTSLEIQEYNQYPAETPANPGLEGIVLRAILTHKKLKTLKISYSGIISGRKIPYLSAELVDTIIQGLPELEHFEFAPEESEIDKIGKALARAPNLRSVTCFPHDTWASYPRPDEPGVIILAGILNAFLSHHGDSAKEKFVWEHHSKLNRVSVIYRVWDVASKFGKPDKGVKPTEKLCGDGPASPEVLYQDITQSFNRRIHVGYDPDFEWVERVAKDLG